MCPMSKLYFNFIYVLNLIYQYCYSYFTHCLEFDQTMSKWRTSPSCIHIQLHNKVAH